MSLVELGWRQFTFFEKSNVQDPNVANEKFAGLKNLKANCCAYGEDFVVFGENNGAVLKLTMKLEETFWMAHKRSLRDITVASNILATAGEDEEGVDTLVKLWQLDRLEKETPFCVRVIRACSLLGFGRCSPATIVALHSSLQHIAIGFADCSILYCTGNILKEKSGKWVTVVNGANEKQTKALTGIALAYIPSQSSCVLYSLSTTTVQSYVLNKTVTSTITHDAKGCGRLCWSFMENKNRLVVGTSEMVFFYDAEQSIADATTDGKGKCHALGRNSEKLQLIAFDSYVVLLTKQSAAIAGDDFFSNVISIYDVDGQCMAFSCALQTVSWLFLIENIVMALGCDGALIALTEKPLVAKLDILFKKNLFDLAVGLTKRNALSDEYLPDVYRRYGDYLYKSGDFENSVQQYIETMGSLEPSYVIKKFLDGSLIKELSLYLEALHACGQANVHHTTILLNCYARLRATKKIENFIDNSYNCDFAVVVQTLRTAGFIDEALKLCEKHNMHDTLLNIYVEERNDFLSFLKHIEQMGVTEIVHNLEKYGKGLVEKYPSETMDLLARVCHSDVQFDVNRLMKIFIGNAEICSRFVELALKVEKSNPLKSNVKLENMLLELRLREWSHCQEKDNLNENDIISLIGEKNLAEKLQVCQMFEYAPGVIHIYNKLERYEDLLEYYMKHDRLKEAMNLCETKGNQSLWIAALRYLSRDSNVSSEKVKFFLERTEKTNSIHPLVVLEILSKSDHIYIGDVRQYIINWIQQQDELIRKGEEKIVENEKKMAQIEEEILDLKYHPQIFQTSKCSACDTSLQLPAIHFLCKHSYHAHCLESYSEKADQCPACFRNDFAKKFEYSSVDFTSRSAYKRFQDELSTSSDCMQIIAKYVEKGLFSATQPELAKPNNLNDPVSPEGRTKSSISTSISNEGISKLSSPTGLIPTASKAIISPVASNINLNPFLDEEKQSSTNPFGDDF